MADHRSYDRHARCESIARTLAVRPADGVSDSTNVSGTGARHDPQAVSDDFTVENRHRLAYIDAMQHWLSLDDVVAAVLDAATDQQRVYVERRGNTYRWSPVSNSGYPLHRTVANYLGVDYTRIYIGFRNVTDDVCIVCEDPKNFEAPDAWAAMDLDPLAGEDEVREAITSRLG